MLDQSKNIDQTLEPLDEYIVIQPVSDETETRAGLILPASAASTVACRTGIVTAVGSEPNGSSAATRCSTRTRRASTSASAGSRSRC